MWIQNYDPAGAWPASTLLAALPVLTLMGLLISGRVAAWRAAAAALLVACACASAGFGMPPGMTAAAAGAGAAFGLIRIVYLVVAVMFLYDLAVVAGRFEVMKATIARLSPDRRIQAVLVTFCFGGFLEGCAGFGAPVAIAAAFLVGLGFRPLSAAVLALVANTACVPWGSVAIPLTTLAAVSGMDAGALSVATAWILYPTTLATPFLLAAIVAGPRRALGAWPVLLAVGLTYATVQLLWARLVGFELVSIVAAIASLAAAVVVLRIWRPAVVWRFEGEGGGADEPAVATAAPASARGVAAAWLPFALLTATVSLWAAPAVRARLDAWGTWRVEVSVLHRQVARGEAVTGRSTPAATDLEPAVVDVAPLSAVGTAVMLAAVVAGLGAGMGPSAMGRVFLGTARRMAAASVAILCMLALGFVTRYSGMDAVLGLAFTRAGAVAYPIFGTCLGWLGTALTGSLTSSNVLFGNLQRITATKLGLSPILMGAANTAGGAMGKMVAAASIVVAAAASGDEGREGEVLRASLRYSLAMAAVVAALVWLAARFGAVG